MQGHIKKMRSRLEPDHLVQYTLPIGEQLVALNPLIGKTIKLVYTG